MLNLVIDYILALVVMIPIDLFDAVPIKFSRLKKLNVRSWKFEVNKMQHVRVNVVCVCVCVIVVLAILSFIMLSLDGAIE